jgi:hypothetical protein
VITLEMNKHRVFKVGEVVHLRVAAMEATSPGRWRLRVDDVTPLPGAETAYFCNFCGNGEPAQEDGSLPEDWTERKAEKRSRFCCVGCSPEPMCRICGCTDAEACSTAEGPCSWVEPDLCSACAEKGRK